MRLKYGAEDLGASDFTLRRNLVQDGGENEESLLVVLHFLAPPVHAQARSFALALGDQRFDPRFAFKRDDGPHLHAFVQAVSDLAAACGLHPVVPSKLFLPRPR